MKNYFRKLKRGIAGTLAAVMLLSSFLPNFPSFDAFAEKEWKPGDTMLSGSADWNLFCIDSYELLHEAGGVLGTNEWYAYVIPSTRMSSEDVAILFWATLSLRASKGDEESKKAIEKINASVAAAGLVPINKLATEEDLKTILHLQTTKNKYSWLKTVLANQEKYMEMAGLLGGSGSTSTGGKPIPTVLQNHTAPGTALEVDKNSFTIEFDPSGSDKDFIQKVPVEFSQDNGATWAPVPYGGWTYQKTDTSVIFSNQNPMPPKLFMRFNPDNTEYQKGGGFASAQDAYDTALQLWVCIECNDRHVYHSQKKLPLEAHQRLAYLKLNPAPEKYFAGIGADPVVTGGDGDITFKVYRHEEEMESTYNLQMYKYDHETGKPTENAVFKLYERFDDKGEIDTEKDGPVHIYEGGEPYKSYHKDNPVIWDNFKFVSGLSTDGNGYASKKINHGYHYDKTFCDGHPAPSFVSVPSEETDEETGDILNEDEIAEAQGENIRLAQAWTECFDSCEAYAAGEFDGVHFHWLLPTVDAGEINGILAFGGAEGETPSAGQTTSAGETESFTNSGCETDVQETYDKFIALKYSYALVESTAREGYILHDIHADDLPVEVITTDSSENGANATFANLYGKDIAINGAIKYTLATEMLAARAQIASYQLEEPTNDEIAPPSLKKEKQNYLQAFTQFLFPKEDMEEADTEEDTETEAGMEDADLVDDVTGTATPSNSSEAALNSSGLVRSTSALRSSRLATSSNTDLASPSNYRAQIVFSKEHTGTNFAPAGEERGARDSGRGSSLFTGSYNTALTSTSSGANVTVGPDDDYSHCNNQDGEENAWRIYDHRTEGELHINKRDMELEAGGTNDYDSYGDSQGDGTLEGAIYGLYAATDIVHPDGKTGVVYKANNLVGVSATDKNGDASFMTNAEAPGYYYNYDQGAIVQTADGWAAQAPKNLYTEAKTYDEYTEDGQYVRTYPDYEAENGNCWIGRPLLMGNYYVKELTRSEGYELSIGNKDNALTNNGQDYNMTLPNGTGYANINRNFFAEGQISAAPTGEYGNPDIDELFFSAESRGTGADGFDIVLNRIPAGAMFYRLDTSTKTQEVQVGTGVYDKVYLTNADGSPKYVKAEHDFQYPKYNADGSLMTVETPTNYQASQFRTVIEKPLDTGKTQTAMERVEPAMTQPEVMVKLATDFSVADKNFLKGKVERALRANGKNTPRTVFNGAYDYSSIYVGVYDDGIREGDTDIYGVSGVAPGQPASKTVYGSPVLTLEIPKVDGMGAPIKVGDAILSVLDFYNTHAFYSYGGIDAIDESADKYLISVYAGVFGNPADFIVQGSDPVTDSTIYHRVSFLPDDATDNPRFVYATYSNDATADAFGTYENYKGETVGSTHFSSATLITDATVAGDGTLVSKTIKQNVYYKTGETPLDAQGNAIQAFEYKEQTTTTTQEVEINEWTEIPVEELDGSFYAHIDSNYTDRYGAGHNDGALQSYQFRVLLPQKEITLTQGDIDSMYQATDWTPGEKMGSASYYLNVAHANGRAYLNFKDLSLMGDSSFVQKIDLIYPKQEHIWQDGEGTPGTNTNTKTKPVGVQERSIKQQIKVVKDIDKESYNNTNSYSETHEDWFTKLFGGFGGKDTVATKMDNFRFKVYLKSNLERLYRDETGSVTWQDRKGSEIDVLEANKNYPEEVSKIFTRVLHETNPLQQDSNDAIIANESLYSYTDGLINENQSTGYTAILETIESLTEDGAGTRMVSTYNYEKLFDAVAVANNDRWEDAVPTYTSWRPIGNVANRTDKTIENAKASDRVRQFAINWYLDDEVAKLVRLAQGDNQGQEDADGSVTFNDETYDEALFHATKKANNYLTPFFAYDLDGIYAIQWDREENGGRDQNRTTLSADSLFGAEEARGIGYHFGLSTYLPYGTYVVTEQQPRYANQEDFKNKHYQIDRPKEIELPAVYESYEGSQARPEALNSYYNYLSNRLQAETEQNFRIRFNEESHIIQAHNNNGDFEVYPYGLDINQITNGVPAELGKGDHFALTQGAFKPYKHYYNDSDHQATAEITYYLAEGKSGRKGVSKSYRYSSVSEHAGRTKDSVKTMHGIQTAFDGKYAAMLVPYAVIAPVSVDTELIESTPKATGESTYVGYGYTKFRNQFYKTTLRIEKLDAETHENILHDEAIFAIYMASRDDSPEGEGRVRFQEESTVITGSKEFLDAMGATEIYPLAKDILEPELRENIRWYGTVAAGTPICKEEEQVVLWDDTGNKTGNFLAFTTKRDGTIVAETGEGVVTADQNVGYLETPQPLGAGVYVLVEIKPPNGYVRTKPIAIEIYSDQMSYYKRGNRDERVAAAIYQKEGVGFHKEDTARIYVENIPIRLQVSKKKTEEATVTYRVSGRVEGSITELNGTYGLENLELAYNVTGTYLGYGWKKGTIEILSARKEDGEQVELLYERGIFSGFADITRPLLSIEDENRYVKGATMTLHDGIKIRPNGDSQDVAFDGVIVERDRNSNITKMYVKQGYAGTMPTFMMQEKSGSDSGDRETDTWNYHTRQRPDTDILFYHLGGLKVLEMDRDGRRYSYDKNGHRTRIVTGVTTSIYAWKNNQPEFEIVSDDFDLLVYDSQSKAFTSTSLDTQIYHLGADGNRDARIHPYTGMAYATEVGVGRNGKLTENVMVWAVTVIENQYGNVIARNKIKTSRIATIHADTSQEYIGGTYTRANGERFEKWMNPILNKEGQIVYYQQSQERYKKSWQVYDRDGEFVYDRYDDKLEAYNEDAYLIKENDSIFDKGVLWDENDNLQENLFMRQGDHYILENTWISGDGTPNDPFSQTDTLGQADMLKRVIPGTYILEELIAPKGYAKALPIGVTVVETERVQTTELVNEKIKIEISKLDAPPKFRIQAMDYDQMFAEEKKLAWTEGKAGYSFHHVSGVTLVLYPARKVYTANQSMYPEGWYFEKTGAAQLTFTTTETATWLEEVPAGVYLVEETHAPSGYVRERVPLEIKETGTVQTFFLSNDHTKLEIYKYQKEDGNKEILPNSHAAGLSLYQATLDQTGLYHYKEDDLIENWNTDDCRRYTDVTDLTLYQKWGIWEWLKSLFGFGSERYSGFQHDFERMYLQYGTQFDALHWYYTDTPYDGIGERPSLRESMVRLVETSRADQSDFVRQIWELEDGRQIRICISPEQDRATGQAYLFEYQYHYRNLSGNTVSYDTANGGHRIDYLPWDAEAEETTHTNYLLVETRTPDGYETATPKLIVIGETVDVQLYAMENKKLPKEPEPPTEETTTPEPEPTPGETKPETPPETKPEPESTPPEPETTTPPTQPEASEEPEITKPNTESGVEESTPQQIPPETSKIQSIGNITATYERDIWSESDWKDWLKRKLSKTKDRSFAWIWMTLAFVSGVGLLIGIRRKRIEKKNKENGK